MQWEYVCCTCSQINAGAREEEHFSFLVNLCLIAKIGPFLQSFSTSDFLHLLQKDLQLGPQVNSVAVHTLFHYSCPQIIPIFLSSDLILFCIDNASSLHVIIPLIFIP